MDEKKLEQQDDSFKNDSSRSMQLPSDFPFSSPPTSFNNQTTRSVPRALPVDLVPHDPPLLKGTYQDTTTTAGYQSPQWTSSSSSFSGIGIFKQSPRYARPKDIADTLSSVTLNSGLSQAAVSSGSRPPVVIDGFLEPNHHVYTICHPKTIFIGCQEALEAMTYDATRDNLSYFVDSVPHETKFKFKCLGYSRRGSASVPFVVRIFSLQSDSDKYAIEFQRRSGDRVLFCNIYRDFLKMLAEKDVMTDSVPQSPTGLFAPPDLDLDQQIVEEHANQAVKSLLQMYSSTYYDVKDEAGRALVDMCFDTRYKKALVINGAVDAFCAATQCPFVDVHRCAITGLTQLTDEESICKDVVKCLDPELVSKLAESKVPQVQRETAHLLSNLAQSAPAEVRKAERLVQTVEQLAASSDAATKDFAVNARSCLSAH